MLGSLEDVLGVVCIGQGKSLHHSIYANRLISKSNMPFLPSAELDSILPGHLLVFKIANHHLRS